MAILDSLFPLSGSIEGLSFYRARGSDKIIVRRKGGPSRNFIRKSKRAERIRENLMEFKGRVMASQFLWRSQHPFLGINDYGVINALHRPLKVIQDGDHISGRGKRHLHLSRMPMLLEGINFNRKYSFDEVVRTPLMYSLSPETGIATIDVPELIPGLTLRLPDGSPFYQIIVSLARVTDIHFNGGRYDSAVPDFHGYRIDSHKTPWMPANKTLEPLKITLTLNPDDLKGPCVYLLTAGVKIGTFGVGDERKTVKYKGAAKVLRAVGAPLV